MEARVLMGAIVLMKAMMPKGAMMPMRAMVLMGAIVPPLYGILHAPCPQLKKHKFPWPLAAGRGAWCHRGNELLGVLVFRYPTTLPLCTKASVVPTGQ